MALLAHGLHNDIFSSSDASGHESPGKSGCMIRPIVALDLTIRHTKKRRSAWNPGTAPLI